MHDAVEDDTMQVYPMAVLLYSKTCIIMHVQREMKSEEGIKMQECLQSRCAFSKLRSPVNALLSSLRTVMLVRFFH